MKKVALSALLGLGFIATANAADITIYHSPTCPHCHHARDYTQNNFIYEYPTMKVTLVDVTVPEHRSLFIDVLKSCEFSSGGVPVIKIGDKCFQGFGESMADDLRAAIEVDLSDDAKKSAEKVRKAIADNGDKYRKEHQDVIANISEYKIPAAAETATPETQTETLANNAEPEQQASASDNKLVSWSLAIFAFVVLVFSVAVSRRKKK